MTKRKSVVKEEVAPKPEEKAPEPALGFEDFLKEHPQHAGLVASFTFEAKQKGDSLAPRTLKEWVIAFEEQSNKTY